jgi:hypothetical protein
MTGIVVLLTITGYQILDVVKGFYMMSEGEELATLFSIVALAFGL